MSASITDTTQSLLLFMTFIVTFFSTALPLATSLLDFRLFGRRAKRTRPLPVPSAVPRPAAPAADVPEAIESEEEPDWEGLKDLDEALPPIEDQAAGATGESADAAAAPDPAGDSEAAPAGEAGYLQFIRFVNGLIAAVRRIRPTLDAYNLFGVDLVMAGAIDVLGQQQDMPADERRRVLKNAIEAMGVKAATAQAFADKYEDYLTESRYMPMIVAGRSTMESFLAGQDTLQDSIGPLFELWNRPQSQINPPSSRIMTVMFTDMVGSTDLTQAQGDRAAQTLVRRHNSIVRSALAEFSGKEIKHTGDGIMASFASAASGVEAAIAIQRAILRHNTQQPDQTLHIRIGINAGEPIEEEEDLFGTTVQLAARVCARCATDAILCSNVVKELASGRSLTFTSLGGQELKGFKDQITLYEVAWRE
jgi:class 3 adenylate cyclase